MKSLYDLHKKGWWIKVSPLARKDPECWICAIFKKGKFSWITEECKEFDNPQSAYEWACHRIGFLRNVNKEELTEEQQMEAWGNYLKETDSGHRPS